MRLTSFLENRIFNYESDTFNARGSQITKTEARMIANRIVKSFAANQLDGVLITDVLADVRRTNR